MKASSGPTVMMSTRQNNHQPSGNSGTGISMYQTVQNEAPQQLFLPGTMKIHMGRKAPVTQHQQHRAHSHGGNNHQ